MPDLVIAARDSSPADRNRADIVCDGKVDVAVLSKALAVPDREIELTAGTFDRTPASPPLATDTSGRQRT